MGLLAAYWDLTWGCQKSCAPCDLLRQSQDQRTEVAALPVLGLRTLAGWRLSGFHGLTTHVFLMRSL